MARPLRAIVEDGWYHVYHRGTEKGRIYADDRDREHFLELLGEVHIRYRFIIHSYILMDSHYHAIIQTPDANLSAGMQWLHQSHAAWYNARHHRAGPFWRGRFGGTPIEDGSWAYEAALYLHLNIVSTVEFGLGNLWKKAEARGYIQPSREEVTRRLKTVREYKWSSYRTYAGYQQGAKWLETKELLRRASRSREDRHKQLREDTKQRLRHGVEEDKLEQLRDAIAIGGAEFRTRVKTMADGGDRETSGKRELRRRVSFEEIVSAVERIRCKKWEALSTERGDWGKPLAMWLARRYGGLRLREIGEMIGGADYAAVSIALKRFEQKLAADKSLEELRIQAIEVLNVET